MGEEQRLGEQLRAIRKARRVTGAELAEAIGVTQGTVSKMETGRLSPDIDYLSKFAHILRLEPTQAAELMRLAGVVPEGATPASFLRFVPCDFLTLNWAERRQGAAREAEHRSSRIRVFQPLLVPGLLQTEGYARHVFTRAGASGPRTVEHAVRSRLRRQVLLADRNKKISFLITEAALRCRLAPSDVMATQNEHLGRVIADGRIRVGIIPVDASPPVPYPPAFYVFDDRVYIELPHGDLWLLDRSNARDIYESLFRTLLDVALFDAAARQLLEKLRNRLMQH